MNECFALLRKEKKRKEKKRKDIYAKIGALQLAFINQLKCHQPEELSLLLSRPLLFP